MYLEKKLFYILLDFYNRYGELDYDTEDEFKAVFREFIKENNVQLEDEEKTIEAFIKKMPFKSWEY